MPVLGSIEPYDGIDQFDSYIERLEHYFVANSIGDFPTGASAEVIQSAEKRKCLSFLQLLVEMLIKLHKHYVVPKCLVNIITMNLLLYFKSITLQFYSKLPSHSNLENVFRKTVNLSVIMFHVYVNVHPHVIIVHFLIVH